ncbi:MAG: hypothetical protein Q7T44_13475 [Parvibaculum sp.]|nr:hypothetical protein [Parvibaculum sp.]
MSGPALAVEPVGDETFEGGFVCDEAAGAVPLICRSTINPGLPSLDFTLIRHTDGASGVSVIDRIDIARRGEAAAFQTIAPVDSNVPASVAHNGFEMIDLNFDGFLDMRVVRFIPAGPNMPYENWLWSETEGKFVANAALDDITSPQFDVEAQEINSHWRSSASEGGSDVYAYDGAVPVLIHRETDAYGPDGTCTRTFFDRIEDELRKTGTGACEDDVAGKE